MNIVCSENCTYLLFSFQVSSVNAAGGSTCVTTKEVKSAVVVAEKRQDEDDEDFFARQTRLQTEARMALAQV